MLDDAVTQAWKRLDQRRHARAQARQTRRSIELQVQPTYHRPRVILTAELDKKPITPLEGVRDATLLVHASTLAARLRRVAVRAVGCPLGWGADGVWVDRPLCRLSLARTTRLEPERALHRVPRKPSP
jgi:hypothetical protein